MEQCKINVYSVWIQANHSWKKRADGADTSVLFFRLAVLFFCQWARKYCTVLVFHAILRQISNYCFCDIFCVSFLSVLFFMLFPTMRPFMMKIIALEYSEDYSQRSGGPADLGGRGAMPSWCDFLALFKLDFWQTFAKIQFSLKMYCDQKMCCDNSF